MNKLMLLGVVLGATFLSAAPISFQWSSARLGLISVDTAQARIGRPGTPMSVAGVNRRINRRGYYGAAAVGAAAAGTYYNSTRCGYYPYPPCY